MRAVLPILGAVAVATVVLLRRRYVVVTVDGPSMLPAYRPGERLLVRRTATVRRDDCVVFAEDDAVATEWIVKRAVAVAGDPVPRIGALEAVPDRRVPAGHLVALGDNPARSYDSRHYGYVAAARVLGVVKRRMRVLPGPG